MACRPHILLPTLALAGVLSTAVRAGVLLDDEVEVGWEQPFGDRTSLEVEAVLGRDVAFDDPAHATLGAALLRHDGEHFATWIGRGTSGFGFAGDLVESPLGEAATDAYEPAASELLGLSLALPTPGDWRTSLMIEGRFDASSPGGQEASGASNEGPFMTPEPLGAIVSFTLESASGLVGRAAHRWPARAGDGFDAHPTTLVGATHELELEWVAMQPFFEWVRQWGGARGQDRSDFWTAGIGVEWRQLRFSSAFSLRRGEGRTATGEQWTLVARRPLSKSIGFGIAGRIDRRGGEVERAVGVEWTWRL